MTVRGFAAGLALLLAGCPGPGAPAPTASLRLVRVGAQREAVVACVASLTGWTPALAGKLVDRAPTTLPGLTPEAAHRGAGALEALGAEVRVLPTGE